MSRVLIALIACGLMAYAFGCETEYPTEADTELIDNEMPEEEALAMRPGNCFSDSDCPGNLVCDTSSCLRCCPNPNQPCIAACCGVCKNPNAGGPGGGSECGGTVDQSDPYYGRFEGIGFDNSCNTDADCVVGGCSGEVCAAEPVFTTCEALPYGPTGNCGCVDGQCIWNNCSAQLGSQ